MSHGEQIADVEAIVQAGGQGTRLGRGPKAFVRLGGRTLLEHAVTAMLGIAARVVVAVPEDDVARAKALVGADAVRIIAGGARRVDTLRALVAAATAPWLMLHDVVHPFVTTELSRRVLDAARDSGAATAALANVDFLYGADGARRAAPGELMAIQKPAAFRRADIERGLEAMERAASGAPIPDLGSLAVLAAGGRLATLVPGHTINFKLTTAEDLALAERLMTRD